MSSVKTIDLGLKGYDELFMTGKERLENNLPKIYDVPLDEIDDFPNHPYKVKLDEDMFDLIVSSLRFHPAIIVPAEVRDGAAYQAAIAGQTGHTVLTSFHVQCDEDEAQRKLVIQQQYFLEVYYEQDHQ